MCRLSSFLVVITISSFALADEATDKELKALQGQWTWVRHEVGGKLMEPDPNNRPVIKIDNTKWSFKNTDSGEFKEVGSFKIDVATKPKCVDLISIDEKTKGQKNECIYKLEEDMLTIVVNLNADESVRPMNFETPDRAGMILVVLERKK